MPLSPGGTSRNRGGDSTLVPAKRDRRTAYSHRIIEPILHPGSAAYKTSEAAAESGRPPPLPSTGTASEVELQRRLHQPWKIVVAGYLAERAVAYVVVWNIKPRPVQSIEHLPPELDAIPFPEWEVLRQLEINVVGPWASHQVLRGVSESTWRVGHECGSVEVAVEPLVERSLVLIESRPRDDIGSVSANVGRRIVVPTSSIDAERKAGAHYPDSGYFPTTQKKRTGSSKVLEGRLLIDKGIVENRRNTQVREPAVVAQVVRVKYRTRVCRGGHRTRIQILGPGEVRDELEPAAKMLLRRDLQTVVGLGIPGHVALDIAEVRQQGGLPASSE